MAIFHPIVCSNKTIIVILLPESINIVAYMKFTDKLKKLRETNGFTQRQIAAILDIDVAVYNRFEKGERKMKRDMVDKIASIYHISAMELRKYWLAEQVYSLLCEEKNASQVINMVAEDISEYELKTNSEKRNYE